MLFIRNEGEVKGGGGGGVVMCNTEVWTVEDLPINRPLHDPITWYKTQNAQWNVQSKATRSSPP